MPWIASQSARYTTSKLLQRESQHSNRPLTYGGPLSHFFPWMTAFLRERFPLQRARSAFDFMSKAPSATIVNPPFRLVDVWNMSAKRPEAHLRPVKDCLHWCMTGVLDHWHMVRILISGELGGRSLIATVAQLFWHMVFEESRNTDYKLR